jgi:hypothetical protein
MTDVERGLPLHGSLSNAETLNGNGHAAHNGNGATLRNQYTAGSDSKLINRAVTPSVRARPDHAVRDERLTSLPVLPPAPPPPKSGGHPVRHRPLPSDTLR